ncbi:putative bifunctional diguanylate cyclase/phosphodiesterase [Pseudalkalibacillus sp. SCS-8]|uniref:putative bifunctional diguanylate cyclase/phosphodiesterase n=1 Tax=Pseudalkalibacillus nanhaiensis TaxID=3115291 RepID=UPI0032DBA92E
MTMTNRLIAIFTITMFVIYSLFSFNSEGFSYFAISSFGFLLLISIGFLRKGALNESKLKRMLAVFTGISIVTVGLAEVLRYFIPVDSGPLRLLSESFWLIHILSLAIGLGIILKKVRTNFQLSYLLLDLHISMTVFGSILYVTYQTYASLDDYLYTIVYPLGTLYVLFILATFFLVIDRPIARPVLNGLLAGISICTISNVVLLIDSMDGQLFKEKYLFLYGLGMFIIASSFIRKQTNRRKVNPLSRISYGHWEVIRPIIQYTGVLVLLYVFIFSYRDHNVLFAGMVVTVLLVICRDMISIVQNQSLIRRLKIFNQQLEKKIGERTKELTDSHHDLENAFKQIEYIATHDPFSRLPNRRSLEQMIDWKIQVSKQNQTNVGLIIIDIDRLKHINDTLGHSIGDELLLQIVDRIQASIPAELFFARHGGDEFSILMEGFHDSKDIEDLTREIIKSVEQPFVVNEKELTITLSIGAVIYPEFANSSEELMKHADLAVFKAKEVRQNKVVFYEPEMNNELVGRMEMLSDLHSAVKRNEFIVFYQPQFDIFDGKLSGVEALVRWQHPIRGFISPGEFIPLAEEFDLIVPIDQIVMETAISQYMVWERQGIAPPRLSVNLCPQQFKKGDLSSRLRELIEKYSFPANKLIIEITESVAMNDEDFLTEQLREISSTGVQISIDDFGTGYSSLSYVKNYPLNQLKIARPFITDVPHSSNDIAMVKAITDLSHHFNLSVVVEGVETHEQLDFLKSISCEEVQGFYFSKPLSKEELEFGYLQAVSGTV